VSKDLVQVGAQLLALVQRQTVVPPIQLVLSGGQVQFEWWGRCCRRWCYGRKRCRKLVVLVASTGWAATFGSQGGGGAGGAAGVGWYSRWLQAPLSPAAKVAAAAVVRRHSVQ
jgi:hypothetical protein